MKQIKTALALLLMLILCFGILPAQAAYNLGDTIPDFTVTTYDGKTFTLSEALKEKEAVLINLWASWCGYCIQEFPCMQEAYEQYGDRVEIIALTTESTDTDDTIRDTAARYGLTFPMAKDTAGLQAHLVTSGIPVLAMIDRFGTVCYVQSGAMPSTAHFCRLFEAFVGESYTQSVVYTSLPPQKPQVTASTENALSAALNVEGGTLQFTNGTGAYDWPLVVTEKDGRSVAQSTNKGIDGSKALVKTSVSAQAGDALAVTFKVSSAAGFDMMQLEINGEVVKAFGGEDGFMTYAYEIPAAGDYDVAVSYRNMANFSAGEDTLWLDSVALLTGDAAAQALKNNPAYPVSDELYARPVNESARRLVITDPTGMVGRYYGDVFYMVPDTQTVFEIGLPAALDPEQVLVRSTYNNTIYALADCLQNGRYLAAFGANSLKTTGYCDNTLYIYPNVEEPAGLKIAYFNSEEDVDTLVNVLTQGRDGTVQGSWAYAQSEPANVLQVLTEATYTVKYVDQHGNPVQGVMCQVCDESTCQVFISDENGLCTFTLSPKAWEIHTLHVPDGYTGDTQTVTLAPVTGGDMVFELQKN